MSPEEHGRLAYLHGCRCETCRDACARYERGRQWDILRGNPRTLPVIGSRRRVQALQRIGWSAEWLSIELGHSRAWLNVTLATEDGRIYRRNYETIRDLYERLNNTPGPSRITALRAEKAGWPGPHAWWNIDDPDEQPDPGHQAGRNGRDGAIDPVVVHRVLGGDFALARSTTKAEKVAIVAGWRDSGRPLTQLEKATGWQAYRYYEDGAA